MMNSSWGKNSWRNYPTLQQPEWPDKIHLADSILKLEKLPSLVFSGETRRLKKELISVNKGKSFILQVGDCAESFTDCNGPKIHNFLRILLQMAMLISYNTNKKVIKIGRIAGQYAKPRSSDYEMIDGKSLPSYRGDNVNEFTPSLNARIPNPERLLEGYFRSASTLNLIRAFTQGGYSDITNLLDWKQHFFSHELSNFEFYNLFEKELTQLMQSKKPYFKGLASSDIIYISHEALLLEYEEAFTRIDTTTGDYYSTSAHSLWIGDRTRQPDSGHVEFASGIGNPIGIKIGPSYNISELITGIQKINPSNEEGKIMLISRMGVKNIGVQLKPLIRAIEKNNLEVIWCCDPMHGNTFSYKDLKVRSFEDITSEIKSFFEICRKENVIPGGIHLEITGEYVSECIGGINGLSLNKLNENYTTKVDPRLNAAQAIEAAFIISKML
jgi:3-deoxy-7-phosphoheptulonate synthase